MKRIIRLLVISILLGGNFGYAQVGIGTTTPESSSILDLSTTSKGMLIPRMTMVQKIAIANPATGLLIYQTDGAEGFWYYTGTTWVPLMSSLTAWTLTGNSGTTDLTNFLGTTDDVPLSFKVNNVLAGRIDEGNSNVFFGFQSGLVNTGRNNAFFGHQAGKENINGDKNTAIGFNAGISNTTGSENTFIGANADATDDALINATAIGSNATVSTSNTLVLGSTGVNVGIGTSAPTTTLDVIGKTRTTNFQMTTSPVLNYALISDASGNGTWGDPTATA